MQFFGKSDAGLKRRENQDSFITERLNDYSVLCLVCDGMGGVNGGSAASSTACSTFLRRIKKKMADFDENSQTSFDGGEAEIEGILKNAAAAANAAVFKKAAKNPELAGMGTTLVGALIINQTLFAINIGDSRLYIVSKESMSQLTHDHSYVQTLIDLGQITPEEAAGNPHKNIITKAVGISKSEDPDIFRESLEEYNAEYILLCSDGLTNYVDEKTIHSVVIESESLERACSDLIDEANKNGGGDNITAVLIKVKE